MENNSLDEYAIYPCTVLLDRYGGSFSKAKWLAFNLSYSQIPDAIDDSDPIALNFWLEYRSNENNFPYKVGFGNNPYEAYLDLYYKLIESAKRTLKNPPIDSD